MASVRQFQVTFDCADPDRLATAVAGVSGAGLVRRQVGGAETDGAERDLHASLAGSASTISVSNNISIRLSICPQRAPTRVIGIQIPAL